MQIWWEQNAWKCVHYSLEHQVGVSKTLQNCHHCLSVSHIKETYCKICVHFFSLVFFKFAPQERSWTTVNLDSTVTKVQKDFSNKERFLLVKPLKCCNYMNSCGVAAILATVFHWMKRIENLILIILQKKSQKFTSFNCETPESHCKGVCVQVLSCSARFCARSNKMTENNTTQQIKKGKKTALNNKKAHTHNIQAFVFREHLAVWNLFQENDFTSCAQSALIVHGDLLSC